MCPVSASSSYLLRDPDGTSTKTVTSAIGGDYPGRAMRSTSRSKKASVSRSTPTWAFGGRSVRFQRSTTVRPRQSSDCELDLDVAADFVSTSPGRITCATATASWIGAPSQPYVCSVVDGEEVDELGDEHADRLPRRGAARCDVAAW